MARQTSLQVATQRAFLSFDNTDAVTGWDLHLNAIYGGLEMNFKNTGSILATNVSHAFGLAFFPGDLPEDFDFPLRDKTGENYGTVGPGTIIAIPIAIAPYRGRNLANKVERAYVWGRIDYGIFDSGTSMRHLTFCMEIIVKNV